MLEEVHEKKKYSQKLKSIGIWQLSSKEKVWDLPLFYCCFHYKKLFIYQLIKLRYQSIKYCYIFNIVCFNISNFVYQCSSQQVKRRQTLSASHKQRVTKKHTKLQRCEINLTLYYHSFRDYKLHKCQCNKLWISMYTIFML
jgi:hypothetical protein